MIAVPVENDATVCGKAGIIYRQSFFASCNDTGSAYLKIPLPQPEVLNQVISELAALLAGLAKR